ncbi:hypothetical protein HUJ04_011481 [Dendroctonus ponderosae]
MPHAALRLCLIMLCMAPPTSPTECPRTCECKWKSGKESVVCSNANFSTVPPNLDSGTQILDLTENHIANLNNQEFSKAGLVNLQKIFLVKCRLKAIEKYAFQNLINLVELDLSSNLLSAVPSSSFSSTPELRELKLSSNPIYALTAKAFSAVPQLVRLEMSDCKISRIEIQAFLGLEDSLEWLRLDNNKLSQVDSLAFVGLANLHGLELAGNPWNCSCRLREFREWMLGQNVPYDIPPICHSPPRLQKKSWKLLDLDEFACPPKIYATELKVRGIEGDNVTLSCSIEGIPLPHVKWAVKNRPINNTSPQVAGLKLFITNEKLSSSELLIRSVESQDAGSYTCAAENKAGKAEAVVLLTIVKKYSEIKFSTTVLLVSVLLGVTLTFLCCLLTACFVSSRKKRLLKWHNPECRREDNYEKIELKPKMGQRNLNGGVARDGALVTIARKNGEYSVVPGTDTDHENDEEVESTFEITTSGTSNEKKWANEDEALPACKNPTPTYAIGQDSRDNINRTCSSTYGTSKGLSSAAPTTLSSIWKGQPIYTTTSSIRPVPDVIGHSSFSQTVSSRTPSENGSASYLSELFCTLPRKRDLGRYRSSDSQTALLPESRYGSDSSADSFARRLSIEMQRYPPMEKQKPAGGSLLNLAREEKTLTLSSTPLLDVRGLEHRLSPQLQPSTGSNPYDYHAAQLEKFLEEYRILQKQLTRMKETCDTICQEQLRERVSPSTVANLSAGPSPNASSIQDSVDFKNFENELTKYLMSRSPSAVKGCASGALPNQNL